MPWFNCDVFRVAALGPEPGDVALALTDRGGAFQRMWFTAVPHLKREMLAIGLASISAGVPVEAEVDAIQDRSRLTHLTLAGDLG